MGGRVKEAQRGKKGDKREIMFENLVFPEPKSCIECNYILEATENEYWLLTDFTQFIHSIFSYQN